MMHQVPHVVNDAEKSDKRLLKSLLNLPPHEISNNVVCATSKASDYPAHMRSLIRAIASHLNIL